MRKILFFLIEYYNTRNQLTGKTYSIQEMPFDDNLSPIEQYTDFIQVVQDAHTQHRGNGEEALVVAVSILQDAR